MIHFFPRFQLSRAGNPFEDALRRSGTSFRLIRIDARQEYRRRISLLLFGYPRLAWAALLGARTSLLHPKAEPPEVVVLSSDVEVLVFSIVRLLPGAAKPAIVLMPFIYTERSHPWANRLRLLYYRSVLRRVTCALCHSMLEVGRYTSLFAGCGTTFKFVPWGTYVPSAADLLDRVGPISTDGVPVVVSAGRSGRDYDTLAAAAAGLPCRLVIVCNAAEAVRGLLGQPHVEVLRDCFGMNYLWQLLRADVVVIPLAVDNISAGQMVIIQAMSLARPLIVTDTATIRDYLSDGKTAILVEKSDPSKMRAALQSLLDDRAAANRLGQAARQEFETRFSLNAHVEGVISAVKEYLH